MALVVARAAGFGWPTAKQILLMQSAAGSLSEQDMAKAKDNFEKLQPSTAQRVVRFYQVRKNAAQ
jgi:cytochrome c553